MEKTTNYCKEYHDKIENTMGKINNTFIKDLYKLNPYESNYIIIYDSIIS